MKFTVETISSDGLVYCTDPIDFQTNAEGNDKFNKAIYNILKSQKFDSIPLKRQNGNVDRVARRRLHDGDLDCDIFILNIAECATVPRKTSILDAIFAVLSNEHHILFVMDEDQQPESVLTMNMLKHPLVRDYLFLKISYLAASGWHWNKEHLDFNPNLAYAGEIFAEIVKLSDLVDDDKPLSTDKEVSQQIVKILSKLQPIKDTKNEMKKENFEVSSEQKITTKFNVENMMSHPVASLTTDQEDILALAYRLFAYENNWDSILLVGEDPKKNNIIIGVNGSKPIIEPIESIKPNKESVAIIDQFARNGCKPLKSSKQGSKWPGIITIDDIALNNQFLMDLIIKISDIEDRCRSFLLEQGELYIPMRGSSNIFVALAGWKNVIDVMSKHKVKGVITRNGINNLHKLRGFRNKVIHEYLPLLNDGKKNLPKWYYDDYIEGVKILQSSLASLKNYKPDKELFYAANGLHKLLEHNGLGDFKYVQSGLINFTISGSGSAKCINLLVQRNLEDKWRSGIDNLQSDKIFSWTNCKEIIVKTN